MRGEKFEARNSERDFEGEFQLSIAKIAQNEERIINGKNYEIDLIEAIFAIKLWHFNEY